MCSGFEQMTKEGSTFLLLQHQVAQAMELVDYVANHHNFDVQVSGRMVPVSSPPAHWRT